MNVALENLHFQPRQNIAKEKPTVMPNAQLNSSNIKTENIHTNETSRTPRFTLNFIDTPPPATIRHPTTTPRQPKCTHKPTQIDQYVAHAISRMARINKCGVDVRGRTKADDDPMAGSGGTRVRPIP